mmetsp:Transcript_18855/g.39057  ORF Transcript_18855/g.39057 Transcript_18855/m.39057 type:complete len:203 (+) Transcript_18855:5271-5879(+)
MKSEEACKPRPADFCFSDTHHLHKFLLTIFLFPSQEANDGGSRIQQPQADKDRAIFTNVTVETLLFIRRSWKLYILNTAFSNLKTSICSTCFGKDVITNQTLNRQRTIVHIQSGTRRIIKAKTRCTVILNACIRVTLGKTFGPNGRVWGSPCSRACFIFGVVEVGLIQTEAIIKVHIVTTLPDNTHHDLWVASLPVVATAHI